MEERNFSLAFSLANGIGPKRFERLLKIFGSAKDAWSGTENDFQKAGIGDLTYKKFENFRNSFNMQSYLEKLKQKEVQFITLVDNNYPINLKKINNAPIVIYVKGDILNIDWNKCIAVVGTRKVTKYGEEVTEKLVSELVANGFLIVSGLALGIDAKAHKTALENNGKTIAVLGSGVDLCYPRENLFLYNKIAKDGGAIISCFPLSMQPSTGTFPARNRIISALSIGVLVTEAGEDSGALITADYAKEQGKQIFAVPGPITSKLSEGTSKLLKNGATFVSSVQDILDAFGMKLSALKNIENYNFSSEEKKIYDVLKNESLNINEISKKTKIDISKLSIILTSLEIKGVVKNLGAGEFGI